MVPRATSASADCYLTPVLKLYLEGFFAGFDDKLSTGDGPGARVEFMTSEGELGRPKPCNTELIRAS